MSDTIVNIIVPSFRVLDMYRKRYELYTIILAMKSQTGKSMN